MNDIPCEEICNRSTKKLTTSPNDGKESELSYKACRKLHFINRPFMYPKWFADCQRYFLIFLFKSSVWQVFISILKCLLVFMLHFMCEYLEVTHMCNNKHSKSIAWQHIVPYRPQKLLNTTIFEVQCVGYGKRDIGGISIGMAGNRPLFRYKY